MRCDIPISDPQKAKWESWSQCRDFRLIEYGLISNENVTLTYLFPWINCNIKFSPYVIRPTHIPSNNFNYFTWKTNWNLKQTRWIMCHKIYVLKNSAFSQVDTKIAMFLSVLFRPALFSIDRWVQFMADDVRMVHLRWTFICTTTEFQKNDKICERLGRRRIRWRRRKTWKQREGANDIEEKWIWVWKMSSPSPVNERLQEKRKELNGNKNCVSVKRQLTLHRVLLSEHPTS